VTAFHPVDAAWPDQPADRGTLTTSGHAHTVVDAVTGGIHDGVLLLGPDLPVRTGTEGWTFVVAHVVEGPAPEPGEPARVDVDGDHRAALSAGHTACHLAALALDDALSEEWTKPAPLDALGHPAFDALAIQRSRIEPRRSVDTYRIGRSLRRKGFQPSAFDGPSGVVERVTDRLAGWVATGGAVRVEREHESLSARRSWVCELPEGRAALPCGGTHISDLSELGQVTVSLAVEQVEGGLQVVMETVVGA
jgi:alanyl-tRNA synthetase